MADNDASPKNTNVRADEIDEGWVRARLNQIWPAHNAALAELLIVFRRQFNGDLDTMLTLLIVGLGARPDDWPGALLDGKEQVRPGRAINTQSISEITGIPRESVRRKLLYLAEKDWISRNERGRWQVTERAARDLKPSTEVTMSYLVKILRAAQEPD